MWSCWIPKSVIGVGDIQIEYHWIIHGLSGSGIRSLQHKSSRLPHMDLKICLHKWTAVEFWNMMHLYCCCFTSSKQFVLLCYEALHWPCHDSWLMTFPFDLSLLIQNPVPNPSDMILCRKEVWNLSSVQQIVDIFHKTFILVRARRAGHALLRCGGNFRTVTPVVKTFPTLSISFH